MTELTPTDPDFESKVRKSFSLQKLMQTIGARLVEVSPGTVTIEMPFRNDLTQQHGYVHAGVITSIVDSACGYAALSLMPADAEVVSVEFKINLLAPARGDLFLARGRVIRSGRTLTVCEGEAVAVSDGREKHVASMLATMMILR